MLTWLAGLFSKRWKEGTQFFESGNNKVAQGDFSGAISDYTKALELNPYDVYALVNRGMAKKDSGDIEGAIEDWLVAKANGYTKAKDLIDQYSKIRGSEVNKITREHEYPYVLVRLYPAVYNRYKIRFINDPAIPENPYTFDLWHPDPFDSDGNITEEAKEFAISHLKFLAKRDSQRLCLVWGPNEAVYVEIDGKISKTTLVPMGGIDTRDEGVSLFGL